MSSWPSITNQNSQVRYWEIEEPSSSKIMNHHGHLQSIEDLKAFQSIEDLKAFIVHSRLQRLQESLEDIHFLNFKLSFIMKLKCPSSPT